MWIAIIVLYVFVAWLSWVYVRGALRDVREINTRLGDFERRLNHVDEHKLTRDDLRGSCSVVDARDIANAACDRLREQLRDVRLVVDDDEELTPSVGCGRATFGSLMPGAEFGWRGEMWRKRDDHSAEGVTGVIPLPANEEVTRA